MEEKSKKSSFMKLFEVNLDQKSIPLPADNLEIPKRRLNFALTFRHMKRTK